MKVNNRFSASFIHLLISMAILAVLLFVIFFYWYPNGLIYAGGVAGLKIVIGVDLVLGPLLTLVVFAPGKKSLKMDLTMIGILQISCLCYGLWQVYNERPVAQVLIDDGVHLLAASDFKLHEMSLSGVPGSYPKKVMIKYPDDTEDPWAIVKMKTELEDNKPFAIHSDLYTPLSQASEQDYEIAVRYIVNNLSDELKELNQNENGDCTWLPVTSTHLKGSVCFSKQNGVEKVDTPQSTALLDWLN